MDSHNESSRNDGQPQREPPPPPPRQPIRLHAGPKHYGVALMAVDVDYTWRVDGMSR